MRIIRFISRGQIFTGQEIGNNQARRIEGDLFGKYTVTDDVLSVEKLLAPLVPTDILCIGLNYRQHAAEGGSQPPKVPMLFIKASNTLNNPGDPIMVPRRSSEIDYEAELVIVIAVPSTLFAAATVIAAVRVPPSARRTSQSSLTVYSPKLKSSSIARTLRPMSRWIS